MSREFTSDNWQNHDYMGQRRATEIDVKAGRAVFYMPDSTEADVYPLDGPKAVFLRNDDGTRRSVIALQAQYQRDTIVFGLVDQNSQHYIATSPEIEVLEQATDEWRRGLD